MISLMRHSKFQWGRQMCPDVPIGRNVQGGLLRDNAQIGRLAGFNTSSHVHSVAATSIGTHARGAFPPEERSLPQILVLTLCKTATGPE
jgi:hypothetical protein